MQYAQFSSPPLRSKSRRRSVHAAHLVDPARRSRVREGRAEFHQRRETILIFVKGIPMLFSRLTKSVRSRRRKENEGEEGYARLLVCLIRVVNPPSLPPSLRCKARAQRNRALETLLPSYFPESSSSSSSRAHRFPFHPPSASPSPFRSFRPFPLSSLPLSVSLFRPLERWEKAVGGGTRSQTLREY